ncbi:MULTISPECIES: ABC transporter permease [Nocardioides]|uniref:ABC transporter permease n=1 Tax=Nocardioides TaxID=1839 RepID=UPI00032EDFED|nr:MULTISPECIES: ABC transporter permease [Nocardioides]EON25447.1 binding-protein-dependent transport system [Nocardioides sp. CF8]
MLTVLSMIARRLLTLVPLVLGITLFVFVVMQFSPVDPALSVLGDQASAAQVAAFKEANGLDRPLPVRYLFFLGDLVRGDLGMTFPPSVPVASKIATALPLTIQLTVLGVLGAMVIGLALGITAALYRDRWPDQVMRFASMAGIAMPSFWLALLLIQEFAVRRPFFPTGGYVNPADSLSGFLETLALPALALAVPVGCSLARIVRTSMVEELDRDYVRTAIGAGLPPHVVVGRNVLRNALVNPLTVLGLRIGYLIGGTVIIEAIFSLPGMGTLIMTAVRQNDTALAQGTILTIALGFVVVNLVVDILYLFANPRLRGGH